MKRRTASSRAYGLVGLRCQRAVRRTSLADFFEDVAKGRDGKMAANWVINELFGRLNKEGKTIETTPVSAYQLGEIVRSDNVAGTISGKIAKDVFEIVWTEGGSPAEIVESAGSETGDRYAAPSRRPWTRSSPPIPTRLPQVKAKPSMLGWFVGQVMKVDRRQGQSPGGQ